jgi:MFS family permease
MRYLNPFSSTKNNIRLCYVLLFGYELFKSTFYGIYSIFILDSLKLGVASISLIKIFNPITVILFEIPTGIIGDRFGKKINAFISNISCALGFVIYAFASNIYLAIIGEILYSMSSAFQNGSVDALVANKAKHSANFKLSEVVTNSSIFRSVGTLLGSFLGVIFFRYNNRLPWLFSSAGFLLNTILTIYLVDDIDESINVDNSFKKESSFEALKKYWSSKKIVGLTFLDIGLSFVNIPFFNYWQVFMKNSLGITPATDIYILIFIAYNILIILGNFVIRSLDNRRFSINFLTFASMFVIFSSLLMVMSTSYFAIITFFMISEFARGLFLPLFFSMFNQNIPDKNRSLYLSNLSFIVRAFSIFIYLISWFFSSMFMNIDKLIYLLSIIGLIISLASVAYIKYSKKIAYDN